MILVAEDRERRTEDQGLGFCAARRASSSQTSTRNLNPPSGQPRFPENPLVLEEAAHRNEDQDVGLVCVQGTFVRHKSDIVVILYHTPRFLKQGHSSGTLICRLLLARNEAGASLSLQNSSALTSSSSPVRRTSRTTSVPS
jgi:hypothetical protein